MVKTRSGILEDIGITSVGVCVGVFGGLIIEILDERSETRTKILASKMRALLKEDDVGMTCLSETSECFEEVDPTEEILKAMATISKAP
jgi:hypothetical protein